LLFKIDMLCLQQICCQINLSTMEIQDIKSTLNIVQVAEHFGLQVDRKTKRANCPFHSDKTPSLQFSEEKQICTCFSPNCSAGTMDVIGFTEKKLGVTKHDALKYLTTLATQAEPKQTTVKVEVPVLSSQALLKRVFTSFENTFLASKHAKDYAAIRALDSRKLSIGYNAGTFHHGENKHLIDDALKLGLLLPKNNSGGNPVFGLASLCFALRDKQNNITGMYFRAVEPRPAKFASYAYEKHLYLKNRKGLYPSYPKPETKKLILTESVIDAATLLSIPVITNDFEILALYGTNGLTTEHVHALQQLENLAEILLFLDGDQGGKEASSKHAAYLKELLPHVQLSIVPTPDDTDVNELAQSHTPEIFTDLLKNRLSAVAVKVKEEKFFILSSEPKKVAKAENEGLFPPKKATPKPLQNGINTANAHKIVYQTETANYYINGGIRKDLDSLKVTLVIEHPEYKTKSRNKLDLYEDKQTEKIARESAEKLSLRADLIEMDLNILTDLLDEYRESLLDQKQEENKTVVIPAAEKEKCIGFLKSPELLSRINECIGNSGVVGEDNNRIFLFGIASSYKMYETMHALIQGSSGSGKTHLLATIMDFMPSEDTLSLTRVTESSFYNYGKYDLQNKLIGMEDFDGLEEKAELAFRELQSKGMISSSTSGKNENTGEITGFIKEVFGPIASLSATTKGEVYEDNMSRCFLVAVDESQEQTQRIIKYQNSRAAGKIDEAKEKEIRDFLRNCIRLLKPYKVVNPFADRIELPKEAHKIRRLNDLFQSYVKQVTLLNQYQRKADKQGRLITEKQDVQTAVEIMFDSIILKVDELDGSLRSFYEKLKSFVLKHGKEYEFTRLEVRQVLMISKTQQHAYLNQLIDLEYIQQVGGYANRGFKYKIHHWDNNEKLRSDIRTYLNKQLEKL